MLRLKILAAVFLAVPAVALLTARSGLGEPAAGECKTRPGATPRGGHWYYHINRVDKRHCWFLSFVKLRVHAPRAARGLPRHAGQPTASAAEMTRGTPPVAPKETEFSPPLAAVATPAPTAPAAASPAVQIADMDFAARWPNDLPALRDAERADFGAPSRSSYAEGPSARAAAAAEEMPQWPLRKAARPQPASAGEAALSCFVLAGGLAIPLLLLGGWAARFAPPRRRALLRNYWRAIAGRLHRDSDAAGAAAHAPSFVTQGDGFSWPSTPTDPACDLKTSLTELMRDLRRAEAAMRSNDAVKRRAARGHQGRRLEALQAAE